MKPTNNVMILIAVILMDIVGSAEVDLFVPSFPELQSVFDLSPFWVEGLLSVNFFGYCLSLLFVGGLSDRYGRKPILLLGLLIFIIGSMLCLWAPSYEFLLMGRLLQGIGAAAPATLSFLIIADSYPLKQQQSLMAMLNGLINITVGAAPVIGSYITLYFHWQGNFMTLLLLGAIAFGMTLIFIPTYQLPKQKESLSLRGYVPIFQSRPLMLLVMNIVFMCLPYWIFLGMSSILYMENLGVSLSHYGYYQGTWALTFALGSIAFSLIMHRFDQWKILYFSMPICVMGFLAIALMAAVDTPSPLIITLGLLPFSLGAIIPLAILWPACLHYMPQAKGRVSAIMQGIRLILSGLGLQLAGYSYQGSFRNIGIIISLFVLMAVITLFWIIKDRELMVFAKRIALHSETQPA